ncbi:hypothetical protein [Actinoplanes sp. NPDC026670]|uniref:hypothetical protein n=1 Tax=Actinoplanes sp. NPDC026670 TaxID=3154700 RepID=UPI0033EFEC08
MRKLWCFGAIATGILFLGGAPAWAGVASGAGLRSAGIMPDDGSTPTPAPTAGIASVSAPPPADTPAPATPTLSPAAPAFAAEQKPAEQKPVGPKPKILTLTALDDPRLLEEPVDGYVNREKWKR